MNKFKNITWTALLYVLNWQNFQIKRDFFVEEANIRFNHFVIKYLEQKIVIFINILTYFLDWKLLCLNKVHNHVGNNFIKFISDNTIVDFLRTILTAGTISDPNANARICVPWSFEFLKPSRRTDRVIENEVKIRRLVTAERQQRISSPVLRIAAHSTLNHSRYNGMKTDTCVDMNFVKW